MQRLLIMINSKKALVVLITLFSVIHLVLGFQSIVPIFSGTMTYTFQRYGIYFVFCLLTIVLAIELYKRTKIAEIVYSLSYVLMVLSLLYIGPEIPLLVVAHLLFLTMYMGAIVWSAARP